MSSPEVVEADRAGAQVGCLHLAVDDVLRADAVLRQAERGVGAATEGEEDGDRRHDVRVGDTGAEPEDHEGSFTAEVSMGDCTRAPLDQQGATSWGRSNLRPGCRFSIIPATAHALTGRRPAAALHTSSRRWT